MKKTIILLFVLLNIELSYGQKMTCKELQLYRDVNLLAILDAETAKAITSETGVG